MIPQDKIDALKKSHSTAWNAKRAAGLTEQQTAEAILAQIAYDEAHPPHLEAVARAKSLITTANLKAAQAATVRSAAERVLAELGEHAELVDVKLVSVSADEAKGKDESDALQAKITAALKAKSLKAAHEALA